MTTPPALAGLSPEQSQAVLAELRRHAPTYQATQSLGAYAKRVMPDTYEQPPHVLKLIELCEAIERGEVLRAIVTMPPRSSKSTHVSRLLPSYYLGRQPDKGVIISSYGDLLATGHGRAVRDLLASPKYPFGSTKLRPDMRAAGQWATDKGGGLLAGGVGSGLTGFGGALLVADDLIKGREEADSELVRDHTWNWHEEVFMTRLDKGGAVLETGTRWHEDDPIGRIQNSPDQASWYVLNLPYLAEASDVLGRYEGEPLPIFGEVPPNLSAYARSALYQQRPTPAGGGVFKAEWFTRRYCVGHNGGTCPMGGTALPQSSRWMVVQSADLGGKQGTGHDPSALATWATDGISFPILDYWSSQDEYADVKLKFTAKFHEWKPRVMFIEDATWAQPLISDLTRETGVMVAPVTPRGSKWTRADAVSPVFQSLRVMLPCRASWLDDWMHQHLAFPNALHDEAVDTSSQALSQLALIQSSVPMGALSPAPKDERPAERVMRQLRARAGRPEASKVSGLGGLRG